MSRPLLKTPSMRTDATSRRGTGTSPIAATGVFTSLSSDQRLAACVRPDAVTPDEEPEARAARMPSDLRRAWCPREESTSDTRLGSPSGRTQSGSEWTASDRAAHPRSPAGTKDGQEPLHHAA